MAETATKKRVAFTRSVSVTINDLDVIERVTGPGGDEWRSKLYNLHTEEDVLQHLAWNCLFNGVKQVNRLDGWADLPDDAATMTVDDIAESEFEAVADGF